MTDICFLNHTGDYTGIPRLHDKFLLEHSDKRAFVSS